MSLRLSGRNKFIRAVRVSATCVEQVEEALNRDLRDQLWWIEQALDEFGEMRLDALEDEHEELLAALKAVQYRDLDLVDVVDSILAVITIKECRQETSGLGLGATEDQRWNENDVILTPTELITIVNEDVLAMARIDLRCALDRGRYSSPNAWAQAVLRDGEPVDLYLQQNGQLCLLDGNHRYLAATILKTPLRTIIH